ncbi:hypothetical protein [Olivibacter oleidegradans]|uniref:Uncharacterized protein n=1 Tax=Olivibacter oleidegradans TaxID=760123 RepID=A0ABV6HPA1_9SPHI
MMKKVFRKLNALALVGSLVAGGVAYAANVNQDEPNVYFDSSDAQWKDLAGMEEGTDYLCDTEINQSCVGHRANPTAPVTNIEPGQFTPLN